MIGYLNMRKNNFNLSHFNNIQHSYLLSNPTFSLNYPQYTSSFMSLISNFLIIPQTQHLSNLTFHHLHFLLSTTIMSISLYFYFRPINRIRPSKNSVTKTLQFFHSSCLLCSGALLQNHPFLEKSRNSFVKKLIQVSLTSNEKNFINRNTNKKSNFE